MVYTRNGKDPVRRILRASDTATSTAALAIFIAFQLIVPHTGYAHFPHLLVLADGYLREPALTYKEGTEGQSQESYSHKDDGYDQDFQHDVCKVSIL